MEPVRLVRTRVESSLSPEQALLRLRGHERPVALVGAWAGGGAVLAVDPIRVAEPPDDPFAILDEQPEVVDGGGGVGGGWFGYLGYQLGARVESLPPPPPRRVPVPAWSIAFYDHVLRLDAGGQWWFEALWSERRAGRLTARRDALRALMESPGAAPRPYRIGAFAVRPTAAGHVRAVERCREHIAAGDLYQANLTVRLEASFAGAGIDLFAACARELRPAYGAYVGDPAHEVVSLSPELFLARRGRTVVTRPIKGTAARTGDRAADARALRALVGSAKDRAENVMIVDLMRNDLGRVCEYATVAPRAIARPERHPGVWHLTSEVTGELAAGVRDSDLLRATFPPGSVTGAPKIRAMELIAALESTAREAYTGAVGYASPAGGLELNVAIRTFEIAGDAIWLGAGGGIVAESSPEAEYEECLVKARPLLRAAGAELVERGRPSLAPADPAPAARRHPPRPDPGAGIFETVAVIDGRPIELERHLRRLAGSAYELYGVDLESGGSLRARIDGALDAPGAGLTRLRISLRGDDVRAEVLRVDSGAAFPDAAVDLVPLALAGGLGPHKWTDLTIVDDLGHGEALLVDLDGSVLETGRGNVFAVEQGQLVTPPADGRILPGVTRAAVIELARADAIEVSEEEVSHARLARADEVFVTSSIRGIQPTRPGPLTRRLAALLASEWGLADASGRTYGPYRGPNYDHSRAGATTV